MAVTPTADPNTPSHSVEDLYLEPTPVQDGGPDVLLGGGGEDLRLKAVADLADRWNVPRVNPAAFERKLGIPAEYCEQFGTAVDAIDRSIERTEGKGARAVSTDTGSRRSSHSTGAGGDDSEH